MLWPRSVDINGFFPVDWGMAATEVPPASVTAITRRIYGARGFAGSPWPSGPSCMLTRKDADPACLDAFPKGRPSNPMCEVGVGGRWWPTGAARAPGQIVDATVVEEGWDAGLARGCVYTGGGYFV
jgi:hypothetical protein